MSGYAIVALNSSFYTFGGWEGYRYGYSLSEISVFDTSTKQWKMLGELNQPRHGHGVFINQDQFIVVGGEDSLGTERCILEGDSIQCKTVDPEIENFMNYPKMMSVHQDFCPLLSAQKVKSLERKLEQKTIKNTNSDVKSWILVLNDSQDSNVPPIIDGNGQSKEIGFNFGTGTEVKHSCSIVWRGKLFVFGGSSYQRQISIVDDCQLTKKGELPFDMIRGACAQRDNQEVFICFDNVLDPSTSRNCHRSNGPLEAFTKLPSSTYDHGNTRIAVTSGNPSLLFNLVLLFRLPYCCW